MKRRFLAIAIAGLFANATPSMAVAPVTTIVSNCIVSGLDDIIPNAIACNGYYGGNLLSNNSADIASQTAGLLALGLSWNEVTIEKLEPGSTPLNFSTLLNGLTYIGIHYGGGQGPVSGQGSVTAFYKFNAGINSDTFDIIPGSISGVSLYATNHFPPVPEPATWALMLVGFGAIGAAMRRRQSANQTARLSLN